MESFCSLASTAEHVNRIYRDVDFLTSLKPARNYQNINSLNRAANYIRDEFKLLNWHVSEQVYEARGNKYRNIVASFSQSDTNRMIVVGAHYDVCGDQAGADDNASAVAGLLETARLLSERNDPVRYSIEFVAYTLEEQPFFATSEMGSAVHAAHLFEQGAELRGMICYEMIGYFADKPGSQDFPDVHMASKYPNTGNFIVVVGLQNQARFANRIANTLEQNSEIDAYPILFGPTDLIARLSDHVSYWRYDYPAVMITDTAFLRNPNYHKRTDTIDTLDFARMFEVISGTYAAILAIE